MTKPKRVSPFFAMSFAESLTFNPNKVWGNMTSGIPQRNMRLPNVADVPYVSRIFRIFNMSYDQAFARPGIMRDEPTCDTNPGDLECNTLKKNRPYVFPPQQLHSQKVSGNDAPTCNNNPLMKITQRETSLYSEDIPQVYVTSSCDTITPEVGPNEPTRDTTYGKLLWSRPVYTFPDVIDTEAKAEGSIWNSQKQASDGFDEWHYEEYTRNLFPDFGYTSY